MTAAELARRAEISKASLSSIESGNGNPTIDTLDALAFALRIPLTDLLGDEEERGTILLPGSPAVGNEITRELLRRVSAGHSTEIWRLRMPPRTRMEGVPHSPGTVENLLVASGTLRAGPEGEETDLHAGDLLSFDGDGAHSYETSDEPADVTVFIVS
jgi:DNA-binding XRE family transcriptional regulator/quercetin dioxygenase-like cupin family protein